MTKRQIQIIIMALTPYLSTAAGAFSTWLLVHVHVFGIFHFTHDQTAQAISGVVIFGITTGITYLTAHTKLFPELVKWVEKDILGQAGEAKMKTFEIMPLISSLGSVATPPPVVIHNYNAPGATVTQNQAATPAEAS